jgi:hypothetical protein
MLLLTRVMMKLNLELRSLIKLSPVIFQSYSIPFLIILFSFSPSSYIPIHLAIVYSVVSTLCFCFSANIRNLYTAHLSPRNFELMLNKRIILSIPIFIFSIAISLHLSDFSRLLILSVTIRKLLDWIDEIFLLEYEKTNQINMQLGYLAYNITTYLILISAILSDFKSIIIFLAAWSLCPLITNLSRLLENIRKFNFKKQIAIYTEIAPHISSTIAIGISTLLFRVIISKYFDDIKASQIISAISIGAIMASIFGGPIGIKITELFSIVKIKKIFFLFFAIWVVFLIFYWDIFTQSFFHKTLFYSALGSIFMSFALAKRNYMLIKNQYILTKDFWIALILVVTTFIICKDYSYNDDIVASLYLISGIINFLLYI